MLDNTSVLLDCSRHESRDINKRNQGNLESITEANEPSCFHRGVDVQAPSQDLRLVTHYSYHFTLNFREPNNDVLGEVRHDLKEFTSVRNVLNNFEHVVSFVWVLGHDVIENVI